MCVLVAGGAAAGLTGCERQVGDPGATPGAGWREVRDEELTPTRKAAREAALAAIGDLQQTLLAQVSASMQQRGPAGTITVCRDLAPKLAEEVGSTHSVRIGRTSHRLRNPRNTGPGWMKPVVEAQRDEVVTMAGPGDAVRLAVPIHVAAPCLACHGQPDLLAPEVLSALGEQYPDDVATGFAEGDLRGWFWAETMETP